MTAGTVRDIRTGRAIATTRSLTATFLTHVEILLEAGEDFYLVRGRCQHQDVRDMITELRVAAGESARIIFDARMPADTVWIFQGHPSELGFAV